MKVNLLSKRSARSVNERWIWAAYIALGVLHVVLAIPFILNIFVYEVVWLFAACAMLTIPGRRYYGDWSHLWIVPMITVASTWLGILLLAILGDSSMTSILFGIVLGLFITVPEILVALAIRWYINWLEY